MTGVQPIFITPKLRTRTAAAVRDPQLQRNLANATDTFATRQASAYSALADKDGLRQVARAAKLDVLARLPEILDRLAGNVEAAGGHVHWAADATEANEVVAAIARRRGARRVVKGKSMASEETGLNEALESIGCEVTETDLGEWIIQVAGETPSHIIVPAIHKDRRQIADALERVAGGDLSDVPEELAAFARGRLRQKFLEADMGITGVNFGVAETGSVVLVTNEGNGRLSSSVPPVHVAIMGIERVVETWDQLDVMLALLPRAATGQAITTYVSVITGNAKPALGEGDGPEEFHLVILDNGRSQILGTEFSDVLSCIRCGACLNACPVYRQAGGHAYGWVYSGPIGAVLTPLLLRAEAAGELQNASSLCGACWDACPVAIPLQDHLLALRRRHVDDESKVQSVAWSAWAATWSRPRAYEASLRAGSLGRPIVPRLPPPLDGWRPARRSFRQLWSKGEV